MDLSLDESQKILAGTFEEMLAKECTSAHVRDCEATGHSATLWARYGELGAHVMGLPEATGGLDMGMLELGLVAAATGRALAPVPFLEIAAVGRLLARVAPQDPLLEAIVEGRPAASLVIPRPDAVLGTGPSAAGCAIVPFGAVADEVVALVGDELVVLEAPRARRSGRLHDLADGALAHWQVDAAQHGRRLLTGAPAKSAMALAAAEWALLAGFCLAGVARRALEIGSAYARERVQFGVPIGGFQSIAHPLAECAIRVDGADLLCHEAAWSRAEDPGRFEALAAMGFVWAAQTAIRTTDVSLHTHGGYGFSVEYDIQLYFRRARALASVAGTPREWLHTVARGLVHRGGETTTDRNGEDG